MSLRHRPAARVLSKFTAAAVIVCLFGYNLSAVAAKPHTSMSTQAVHDLVVKVGVGNGVSARISSAESGTLRFRNVRGRIVAISDTSLQMSVKTKGKTSVETYAYKDVAEIHEVRILPKGELVGAVLGATACAILVYELSKHYPNEGPIDSYP